MTNPPTPRRCRRILEAHHLDCQGLFPDEIAAELRCARSTVYDYFRDFQTHRAHILRTVAADRLADQVHILSSPETDPDQHRQTVAAARELRLLLTALPRLEAQTPAQPAQPADGLYAILSDPEALRRQYEYGTRVDPDGHHRHIRGPSQGECSLACPACLDRLHHDPDEPRTTQTEPDQPSQNPDQSAPIRTNLDKSGQRNRRSPVPAGNPSKLPRNPARPSRSAPITRSHGTTPSVTSRDTTPKSPGFARCSANRRSGATRPSHSLASAALSPARLPTDNPPPEKGPPCT